MVEKLIGTFIWSLGLIFIIVAIIFITLTLKKIRLTKKKKIYSLLITTIPLISLSIFLKWFITIFLKDLQPELRYLYESIFIFSLLVISSSILIIVTYKICNIIMSQCGNINKYGSYIKKRKKR